MILAHCPHCGAAFRSSLISATNVRNLTLINNRETCPACGQMAETMEGVFNVTGDVVQIISAPRITTEMLAAFGTAVERAQRGEITEEELVKEADRIDPLLGDAVRTASLNRWGLIAPILVVVWMKSCNFTIEAKVDINQLFEQALSLAADDTEGNEGSRGTEPSGNGPGEK